VKKAEEQKALAALQQIIPLLEKYGFTWVITGGFACYAYGASRNLTDIDIDIDASKDTPAFKAFMKHLEPWITQPLEHFVDQNYDNYNFEITVDGAVMDICPMAEMNVFNQKTGGYEHFYRTGFPESETVDFHDLKLPLLSKRLIIKNKEMLPWQRESDLEDIRMLRHMLGE
jgi:hypothetical protein